VALAPTAIASTLLRSLAFPHWATQQHQQHGFDQSPFPIACTPLSQPNGIAMRSSTTPTLHAPAMPPTLRDPRAGAGTQPSHYERIKQHTLKYPNEYGDSTRIITSNIAIRIESDRGVRASRAASK